MKVIPWFVVNTSMHTIFMSGPGPVRKNIFAFLDEFRFINLLNSNYKSTNLNYNGNGYEIK